MKPIFIKLTASAILLATFFSACKKSKQDDDIYSGNKELSIDVILEAPVREKADGIAASMDGKYLFTFLSDNVNFSRIYFSKDAGQNWDDMQIAFRPENEMLITKSGYTYLRRSNNHRRLYNLNTKEEVAINFQGTPLSQWEDYYLGHDDYIYARNSFKKIGEDTWSTMPATATGLYCGQDANNGGAAFYDAATKKLNIHNPANNTVITHNISIDVAQVSQGPYQPNRPERILYNGFNKFAIAYTKGVAIQDLSTGAVTYTDWETPYVGYYLNPVSISIDKEGTVFTTLGNYGIPTVSFKLAANKYTPFYNRSYSIISRGDYTYYLGGLKLVKESASGKTELYTSYSQRANAERAEIKSARVVAGKTYVILTGSSTFAPGLYTYSADSKNFSLIERVVGNYEYIYSEGANIYVYGTDSILHSANNGADWSSHANSAGAGKSINYIIKSGSTYYGLHVKNGKYALGGTGFQIDRHNFTTYSSTDAINWTAIASKVDQNGLGPEALTPEGLMTYINNSNPLGNAVIDRYVSFDYGATWDRNQDVRLFNSVHNNELFMVAYNGNGVDVVRYDKNFKELSSQKATQPASYSYPVAGVKNVHFDNEGKINFITGQGFFKIR